MKLSKRNLLLMAGLFLSLTPGLNLGLTPAYGSTEPAGRFYQQPNALQLQQAEQIFNRLFAGETGDKLAASARALGFSWKETETEVRLLDKGKRGWGDYYFSKQPLTGVALMAPHRYHDKHTGTIARRLFRAQGFSSLALNSLPRVTPIEDNRALPADLARLTDSVHFIYSRTFALRYPTGQLVQLHGFSSFKRRTKPAQQTSMILSTGGSSTSAYVLNVQRCFGENGWHSLRYPQQVSELGATRNSIGALLRSLGHTGFTHIEMNLQTRQALLDDSSHLLSLAGCLIEAEQ